MTLDFNFTYQRTRDNSNDFTNNRIGAGFTISLSCMSLCVSVCGSLSLSLSLSVFVCVCVCLSVSVSVRVSVCACLSSMCPSLRLFRLVGETFGCKQVCGVFVWHKTTTMHLIFLQEDATVIFLAEKRMEGKVLARLLLQRNSSSSSLLSDRTDKTH